MRSIFAAVLLVCFVPVVRGADEENPYKNAKVGDWVEYKTTGQGFEGKTKMTITAKDDKEVTYEVAGSFTVMGKEMTAPVQTMKIDLTKPYDAISAANMKANNTKIETTGEGKEKLKLAGKEYDTKWSKLKATTTVNGMEMVSEYKMWYSKAVPLGGMVKMETTVGTFTATLELTGTGSK